MATLHIQSVEDLDHPDLKPYRTLRRRKDQERKRRFVVEGEKVVRRLLQSRFPVESLLITEEWLRRIDPLLASRSEDIRVFVASRDQIESITGFSCYQGIKAMSRIEQPDTLESALEQSTPPRLWVALEAISNAENVGVIIRNCAALGVQAILVGETSCSPFLTRAIRTSMGAIFRLPAVESDNLIRDLGILRARGIRCIAAHPAAVQRSPAQTDLKSDCCLVFGSEGYGLTEEVVAACTEAVAIPMARSVDSLNVSSAAAAFLYEVNRQRGRL